MSTDSGSHDDHFGTIFASEMTRGGLVRRAAASTLAVSVGSMLLDDVAALAATPKRGGILTFNTGQAGTGDKLDPATVTSGFSIILSAMLYENLVRLDTSFNPRPGLATAWDSSPNLMRWTFRLRDGVEFHDGRKLVAEDVAYSIKRVLSPKVGSQGVGILGPVLKATGIKVLDARTVQFSLTSPHAFFPVLLGGFYTRIIPSGYSDFSKANGTGPFKLKSFQPGGSFELVKNANYWRTGRPYLDGVRGTSVTEASSKIQSVTSGNAHIVDDIDYTQIPSVRSSGGVQLVKAPGGILTTLITSAAQKPTTDVRVRQAMKYAVDRKKMASVVYAGAAMASADVCVPPGDPFYPAGLKPLAYDPERAKSLLKAAGYGDGISIDMFTSEAVPAGIQQAVAYKDMAKSAGISVNVRTTPAASYWTTIFLKKPYYVDYVYRLHVAQMFPYLHGAKAPGNEGAWVSPKAIALANAGRKTRNVAKQKQFFGEALRIESQESGQLIPVWGDKVWVAKRAVGGVKLDWVSQARFEDMYLK